MDLFSIISTIVACSALFGYFNVRFLKLPNTIGLMLIAIAFTLAVYASSLFTDGLVNAAHVVIDAVDFETVLLDVMLGFLLFAGAMHTNFDQLKIQRWPVLVFSTLGVLVSTFLVGIGVYFSFRLLSLEIPFIQCLLFGALISPTDPIAVLGILKKAGVPKELETKIVGESLFNDGVGVVVFITILSVANASSPPPKSNATSSHLPTVTLVDTAGGEAQMQADTSKTDEDDQEEEHATSVTDVILLFVHEVFGGILMGLVLGYLVFRLLRSIDAYEVEVMITLACVMGGYSLAHYLHLSAPLAIVVAGLIVGNDTVRGTAMSHQTEQYVDRFWELVDMLLNAILFVLIGLYLLELEINPVYVEASMIAIVVVLLARFLSLLAPVRFFAERLNFVPHTTTIMTWGGLRGGISIALALGLPMHMNHELFVTVTYGVVVFSIVVQGLSVGKLANRLIGRESVHGEGPSDSADPA